MSHSRPIRDTPTSLDHLTAEVAVYPFASEGSLATAITQLDPNLGNTTWPFWQHAERELLLRFPGVTIDEMRLYRDAEWFANPNAISCADLLVSTAKKYLEPRGLIAVPSRREERTGGNIIDSFSARTRWRWISRSMPSDLLMTALWDAQNEPRVVALAQPQLAQRLADEGFAELHLHMGAGLDFPAFWATTMARMRDPLLSRTEFESSGAPFDNGKDMAAWLGHTSIARQVLAEFLIFRSRSTSTLTLGEYLNAVWSPAKRLSLGFTTVDQISQILSSLAKGTLQKSTVSVPTIKSILQQLTSSFIASSATNPFLSDPMSKWFPTIPSLNTAPETLFIASALRYLPNVRDNWFALLFWQTQRVRGVYFRSVVQSPRTPGLTGFTRHYSRLSAGRRLMTESAIAAECAHTSGIERGLRYLELRTSPYERAQNTSRAIRSIDSKLKMFRTVAGNDGKRSRLQWGLILHFLRLKSDWSNLGRTNALERNCHANPEFPLNLNGYRFEACYSANTSQATSIINLMIAEPSILNRLRAIDLCTDEMAIPIWVFVEMFRVMRRESEQAIQSYRKLRKTNSPDSLQPLRCTVHVGEDFPHLLTGLRNIGLVLEHLNMREGDRLGHALALGIDCQRWSTTTGRVRMPAEERLFDLVWARDCVSRHGCSITASGISALEREIARLSKDIFGRALSPFELSQLLRDLHDSTKLAKAGFPFGPVPAASSEMEYLIQFLTSPNLYIQGRKSTWVDTSDDLSICRMLQHWLRMQVSNLGLAIEINPSSNLLIGNLGDLKHHPFWSLANFANDQTQISVPLVVGSDDPITFGTTLPDEYSLLYDALIESGVSSDKSLRWLDELRRTGNDFRFTVA